MRRRGTTRRKPAKTLQHKPTTPKRSTATNAARRTPSSLADLQDQLERQTRELQEARDERAAIKEVLRVISSSPGELEPVFQAMLANATRICEAKFGILYRCEGDALRTVAMHDAPQPFVEVRRSNPIIHPNPDTTLGRAMATKQPVQIADILEELDPLDARAAQLPKLAGARTVLAVPMLKENELVGAFVIYRTEVRPFTDKQIELVQNFAAQAVIAIENARLLNELRQRTDDLSESLDQQTATSEVLKVISSSPGELEPVFNSVLANAVHICGAKFGMLFLWEGEARYRVAALEGAPPRLAEKRRPGTIIRAAESTGLGIVASTRQTAHIYDVQAVKNYFDPPPGFDPAGIAVHAGARVELAVPMLKENELVGAIVIYRTEVRPFTDKQIDLVKNFAHQAVIAIENTRLLNELRQSLQQQTATADVLKVISRSTFDLQAVLDTLVELATRLCEAYDSVIFMREGTRLHIGAHHGPIPFDIVDWPIGPGWVTGRAVLAREPVHVHDLQASAQEFPEGTEMALRQGHRTTLAIPLIRENEAIGAITIRRTEVRPFSDKQIDLVATFADQAVIAIENARLLNELRQSLQQQTATADVLKVISRSAFDLQAVLDTLVESAARLCEAQIANIWRPHGTLYKLAAAHQATPENKEYLQNLSIEPGRGSCVGRTLLEGKIVHIHDIQDDPEYALSQRTGYRTMLGVPLLREGSPIGVIALARSMVRPFTDKQIELATTFADQAVIAIENARLFDEVQTRTRELSQSVEELRALGEVSQAINSTLDIEAVLTTIVAKAVQLSATEAGTIYTFDQLRNSGCARPMEWMRR